MLAQLHFEITKHLNSLSNLLSIYEKDNFIVFAHNDLIHLNKTNIHQIILNYLHRI